MKKYLGQRINGLCLGLAIANFIMFYILWDKLFPEISLTLFIFHIISSIIVLLFAIILTKLAFEDVYEERR